MRQRLAPGKSTEIASFRDRSSTVERRPSKAFVVGSNPTGRSTLPALPFILSSPPALNRVGAGNPSRRRHTLQQVLIRGGPGANPHPGGRDARNDPGLLCGRRLGCGDADMRGVVLLARAGLMAVRKAADKVTDRVLWLDRGWQPAYIGFCPSAAAWRREMRRMGVKNCPYPDSAGRCTSFEKEGGLTLIVTLGKLPQNITRVQVAGLLCHEATHVWQEVRKNMGEASPSIEFEAYSVQAIFQSLYAAWLDNCAPPEMLARGPAKSKS